MAAPISHNGNIIIPIMFEVDRFQSSIRKFLNNVENFHRILFDGSCFINVMRSSLDIRPIVLSILFPIVLTNNGCNSVIETIECS